MKKLAKRVTNAFAGSTCGPSVEPVVPPVVPVVTSVEPTAPGRNSAERVECVGPVQLVVPISEDR